MSARRGPYPQLAAAALLLAGCSSSEQAQPPAGGAGAPPSFPYPLDDVLRMDHLQAKSTHNSYHVEPDGNALPDWAYTHAPLDTQLGNQGVRHFELDLRFSYDEDAFEVYHLPVIDEVTTCRRFSACLALIKQWSDAHRAHHPIVVQIEIKDPYPGPAAIDDYFTKLESEILAVWPPDRIVTPADVQRGAATLAQALAQDGWPTLGEVRGRVLFAFNDTSEFRTAYTHGLHDLDGRLVFAQSDPGNPFAAYAVHNDPLGGAGAIAASVAAGLLVRTRADSGGPPAGGDTTRLVAALGSGAHFITTDFPAPVDGVSYVVDMPGGTPTRCNPVTAPAQCTSTAIEDPAFVGP